MAMVMAEDGGTTVTVGATIMDGIAGVEHAASSVTRGNVGAYVGDAMIEAIILLLIYLGLIALAATLVMWVLGQYGLSLPPQVVKIVYIIAVLVVILMLYRIVAPSLGIAHFPAAHGMSLCEVYGNCEVTAQ